MVFSANLLVASQCSQMQMKINHHKQNTKQTEFPVLWNSGLLGAGPAQYMLVECSSCMLACNAVTQKSGV